MRYLTLLLFTAASGCTPLLTYAQSPEAAEQMGQVVQGTTDTVVGLTTGQLGLAGGGIATLIGAIVAATKSINRVTKESAPSS